MGYFTRGPKVNSKGRSGDEAFKGLDLKEQKELLKRADKKQQNLGSGHTISADEDGGYNVTRKKGW